MNHVACPLVLEHQPVRPEAAPGTTGRPAARLNVLVNGLLLLGLWVPLLHFPAFVPGPNSDQSWMASYAYFFKHRLRAGVDYVFTDGPLGYFQLPCFDADLFGAKYAWEVAVKFLVALALVYVTRRWPVTLRAAALLLVTVFARLTFANLDVPYEFLLLVGALSLVRLPADASPGRLWPTVGLIATLAQIKFTFLVFAGGAVAVTALALAAARRFRRAAHLLAAWGACFLGLWVVLGQSPADLPAYLTHFTQVSSGYSGAMATFGDPAEIALCLSVLALLAFSLIPLPVARLLTPAHLGAAAVVGLCLFIEWKHGFVRHDSYHATMALAMLTLVPLVLPAFFPACNWRSPVRVAALTGAFGLGLAGILMTTHEAYDPVALARSAYHHARHNLRLACLPNDCRRPLEQAQTTLAAQYDLPQIRAAVGAAPVDIWSYEQAVLLLNRLNYHPRPVFQGYTAYTPALLALNAHYFHGDAAPPFLIFKLQTIDERHPLLDDGPALVEVFRRYKPILAEKGYLLLQKQDGAGRDFQPEGPADTPAPQQKTVTLGEEVSLADLGDGPLRLALDVRYTGRGKWWAALYKPPALRIRVRTADQAVFTYRLPVAMARAGFLIHPLLLDNTDVLRLYAARPTRRVVSFCLLADPADLRCFRRTAGATLEPLPHLVGAPLDARAYRPLVHQLCYYMMHTEPREVRAGAVYADSVQGTPVLVVHADGQMRFDVPAGATELTGQFGIAPGAYEGPGQTDGVQFVVEYRPERGGSRVLFARHLDPLRNAQDRGMQALRVPLPSLTKGELLLRTTNLPGKTCNWDWSYWTGVRIQ